MTSTSSPVGTPAATPSPAPPASPWYAVKAPPRPGLLALLCATLTSTAALLLMVAVGKGLHQVVLIPPLAASARRRGGAGTRRALGGPAAQSTLPRPRPSASRGA
ncbi:hypothetical protein ACWDOX_40510, partial [Streptomyces sp. NPDC003710]